MRFCNSVSLCGWIFLMSYPDAGGFYICSGGGYCKILLPWVRSLDNQTFYFLLSWTVCASHYTFLLMSHCPLNICTWGPFFFLRRLWWSIFFSSNLLIFNLYWVWSCHQTWWVCFIDFSRGLTFLFISHWGCLKWVMWISGMSILASMSPEWKQRKILLCICYTAILYNMTYSSWLGGMHRGWAHQSVSLPIWNVGMSYRPIQVWELFFLLHV